MGRAAQSSKLSRLTHAENAIDGRLDAECLSGSCAHTWLQSDPRWRVDLLAVDRVTSITVTNREDCCPWRLDAAEILIGSSLKNNGNSNPQCAVISSIAAGDSVTFQCHGMEGHFVNIICPGRFNPCLEPHNILDRLYRVGEGTNSVTNKKTNLRRDITLTRMTLPSIIWWAGPRHSV
ncbi:fucolectin-like [Salmo trutta]|uniref:fucolectin-like n=1 Tax=Salmo trutta TaxID=8032 RepID=UPI0011302782|nr:fucolectin-like [Salmo trutta]